MVNSYVLIADTLDKLRYHLDTHQNIVVSVSGGSDSNIIVDMIVTHCKQYLPKVHFVFMDTGLEYAATRRHLKYMEEHYDIKIEKIRGMPIPLVVKKYGVPVVSKKFSLTCHYAPQGKQWAIERLTDDYREKSYAFSPAQQALGKYIIDNGIQVSDRCCYFSKKAPIHKYLRAVKADLNITGERKAEGGQRTKQTSCFSAHEDCDKFMPLFFWDDETKLHYKESRGVVYSDCYEVWGMERTGCVGCPYNSNAGRDLKMIQKYEPKLYKACMNIFGEAYRLQDMFHVNRHKILEEEEK